MGNGQLHHMTAPPLPTPPSEELREEMEQKQSKGQPQASSTSLPTSTSLPPITTPPAVPDMSDPSYVPSSGIDGVSAVVIVRGQQVTSESIAGAQLIPSSPAPTALLSPLTPRARMLPAILRPPSSPSAPSRGSLSPRQPLSASAPLSSPLPPPSPSAEVASTPPSTASPPAASGCLPASAPSISEPTSAPAPSNALLPPPRPNSPSPSDPLPTTASFSPAAPLALLPVVSPSAKSSWQLDNNEHRSLICRFCGGAQCKHEDYTRQPNYRTAAAIAGLNSSHITPNLIAMQRPSTSLIHTHAIAQQFQQLNITAIINCQQTGEHALCGPGIQPHGFSYHPDDLPHTHHYNFGWVDMGTPPIERMLNIVQVMAMHETRGGRVAVHCHAGYGRTGMVIACYLVFAHHYSADMAITTVRQKREGSVQTKEQKRFCYRFEQYIKHLRQQYHITATTTASALLPFASSTSTSTSSPTLSATNGNRAVALPPLSPPPASQPFQPLSPTPALPPSLSFPLQPYSLSSILTNQRLFLHGHERQHYRYISKLVSLLAAALDGQHERLCEEIEQRAVAVLAPGTRRERGSFLLHLPFDCTTSWTLEDSSTLEKIKHAANLNDYSAIHTASPFIVLVALLHFLTGLTTPLLPFYTYAPTLPTTLSTCFASIPRMCVPTLDVVVRLLHGLQFVALVRSSDVRPMSTFVVLAFAFALLHPNCPTPSSLALLIPIERQATQPAQPTGVRAEVDRKEGDKAISEEKDAGQAKEDARREEEEGASLGSMLCFMSVLLTEWHEEHAEWTKREEEERQSTRVGARKGERWWLGQDALSPGRAHPAAVTDSGASDGAVTHGKAARARRSNSRRNSQKRSARGSGSRRGSRKSLAGVTEPDKPDISAVPVAAEVGQIERGISTTLAVGKVVEEEKKEQGGQVASEVPAITPLATARGAKRGSSTRPILPPLKVKGSSVASEDTDSVTGVS